MIRLLHIEKDSLDTVWPLVWPYLASAVERSRGRFSEVAMRRLLEAGDWLLWAALEHSEASDTVLGVAVTEILVYPAGKKVINIPICTGVEAKKWAALIGEIEKWGKTEGATAVQTWARRGWAKHLQDYEMTHVLLEKEIGQ